MAIERGDIYRKNNYIALVGENYVDWHGTQALAAFNQAKTRLLRKLQRSTLQTDLKKAEEIYNSQKNLLSAKDDPGAVAQRETILQKLIDKFGQDVINLVDIDFNTGSVSLKTEIDANVTLKNLTQRNLRNNSKNKMSPSSHRFTTISNRIEKALNKIYKIQKENAQSNFLNKKDADKIKQSIEGLEQLQDGYRELVAELSSQAAALGRSSAQDVDYYKNLLGLKDKTLTSISFTETTIDHKTAQAIIKQMNSFLRFSVMGLLSQIRGALGEYIGITIANLGDLNAIKIADKAVLAAAKRQGSVTGGRLSTGNVKISLSGFNEELEKQLKECFKVVDEGNSAEISWQYSSQQKADFTITIDDKDYGVSHKSYELKYPNTNIHLVSETPLTTLLFAVDSPARKSATHFLNILAAHQKPNSEEQNYTNTFQKVRAEGLKTLSYIILWQAMSGSGVGKKSGKADILMINNTKTGYTHFININELIWNLVMTNQADNIKNSFDPRLEDIRLLNAKIGDASTIANISTRIARLYGDAHSKKITVHTTPKQLGLNI